MGLGIRTLRCWGNGIDNYCAVKGGEKLIPFPDKKYKIIYADPPWEYKESGSGNRVVSSHYPTMDNESIKSMPIHQIADETCILFIWVTFPRLKQGLDVIESWGFEYYGLGFDWVKTNPKSNTPFWGMGYYTRQNTEVCLIGVRKNKKHRIKPQVRNILSVVHSIKREHSRKPDEIREYIVQICGDLPRIELFARQVHEGWDVWGNEVNKITFDIINDYLKNEQIEEAEIQNNELQKDA